jgi:DNA invertase Pin-like site-specific DNA recombinase
MSAATVGYARVSTSGQSLDIQLDKLTAYGCTKIFAEKRSGKQAEGRPELQACLQFVREGDTLVISRLDRMARSILDLAKIADQLKKKGVSLRVLDQAIDTGTSEGRLMFSLLASFAEFENDIRAERQMDGIAKAKERGVTFGRKRVLTSADREKIKLLREEDKYSVPQLADRFNVGVATIYRSLREPI